MDLVALLPPILSSAVTSNNKAIYYKRQTRLSDERYRPKTAKDQWILYRDFLRVSLRLCEAAPLSRTEKLLLMPYIISYSRHGTKFKRIVRAALREALAGLLTKKSSSQNL